MQIIFSFVAGLLFSLGLVVSGLINPAKVQNFLDLAGTWDPSLAFTMAAAIATTAIGYRLAFRNSRPLFADAFQLPTAKAIDIRLIGGAAVFGIGWGLIGFCPGPAVAALATGSTSAFIFVGAMLAGMFLARTLERPSSPSAPQTKI
ncbi:gene II and X protein [Hyphomicrobium sulfonivorans]|uniref:Gene II and X protein n=1 Tax=Hyphomicrobium sulfonivorans TaxID=121290 RepID=A0A120CTV1_HYPSL|nr:DUF6691 family protein [Hyphomicrobium sulfonivorans]KWT65235.1 gene II and X protein [Hyphomicrobium sulfonivorans]